MRTRSSPGGNVPFPTPLTVCLPLLTHLGSRKANARCFPQLLPTEQGWGCGLSPPPAASSTKFPLGPPWRPWVDGTEPGRVAQAHGTVFCRAAGAFPQPPPRSFGHLRSTSRRLRLRRGRIRASLCLALPSAALGGSGVPGKDGFGAKCPKKAPLGQWCRHHAAGACGIAPEGQHHSAKVSLPSFPWTLCDGVSSLWGHKKLPAPPCPLRPSHRSWDLLSSLRGQLPALVQGTRLRLPSAGHVPHVLQE